MPGMKRDRPQMPNGISTDIKRLIGKTYADRGRAYARQGRVTKSSGAEGRRLVFGWVRGSGKNSYSQTISLDWSADGRLVGIDGGCSCPVGHNCKHVAAVLFDGEAVLSGEDRREPPRQPAPIAARKTLSGALQTWFDIQPQDAAETSDEYPAAVHDRIYYVLMRQRDRLMVEAMKVRLKKDGTLGKGARRYELANINSPTPPKFIRPIDLKIRRYLRLADQYYYTSGTPLPDGEEGQKTFELLLSTGRARWEDATAPPLALGPSRMGRFVWHQDGAGTQTLWVETREGVKVLPLPLDPPFYLDPETGMCGPLDTGISPKRVKWLAAAPKIAPREVERFAKALAAVDEPAVPMPLSIETIARTDILPTPMLRLHAAKAQEVDISDWRGYRPRLGEKEIVPALSLTFDYDGEKVSPDDRRKNIETFDGDKLRIIQRHAREEARHLADLADITLNYGFDQPSEMFESVQMVGKDVPDFILWPFENGAAGVHNALDFLSQGTQSLNDLGWRVNVGKDWPCTLFEGEHDLVAGVKEGRDDWFSLALNIEVDGKEIDLLPLILQFLGALPPEAQDPDFDLAVFFADRKFFVPLEGGRYLPVEAAPLAPVFKAFLALNGIGDAMHPAEAGTVADIAEALEGSGIKFKGGEKLRALGTRLRALANPDAAPPLPNGFCGELRPYQKIGLGWMTALAETGFGGVLADDMGLGKTVQALAYLAARVAAMRDKDTHLPSLLIVPTSLVGTWTSEAARFTPALKVLVLHGPERKSRFDEISDHDIVITTYPLLHRDKDVLFSQEYDTALLDEAQMVKNPTSRAAKLIREIKARQRLALSGTPMENNLEELWSLYDWLIPGLLGNRKTFGQIFRKPIEKDGDRAAQLRLSKRISPFLLRRTKELVAADLPPKTVITETIELSGAQRELYESIRLAMDQRVRAALDQKGLAGSRITVLDALLKLRQVCCDPALVKLPAARDVSMSAKRTRLLTMLDELMAEGRRVLVFSQFVEMLRLIEGDIKARGYDYAWLSGQTKNRTELVERFQSGDVPIFLISLKAGGVGLTLTAADTVILYDPWWNPAVERQAMDRTHRIGQDKPVFVHRLITEGTVETRIEAIQARKQDLADALFDPKKTGPAVLSEDEILSLFQPLGN